METVLVWFLCSIFRLLPLKLASKLGGSIAEVLGRRFRRSNTARRNLQRAMPDLNHEEIESIVSEMWNNLGRTFAEFPHIAKLGSHELKSLASLEGEEYISNAIRKGNGTIFFTGHLGNWEIGPRLFSDLGYPVSIIYRKGNNPGIACLIQKLRSSYLVSAIPKGQAGSREIIKCIKKGEAIGILVDQKMNDGIKSTFFGIEAMTAPAIASLALKYHCPVLPVRVIRLHDNKFRVVVSPPLEINYSDESDTNVVTLIYRINSIVEKWVREYPGQWIWLHNRWSDRP